MVERDVGVIDDRVGRVVERDDAAARGLCRRRRAAPRRLRLLRLPLVCVLDEIAEPDFDDEGGDDVHVVSECGRIKDGDGDAQRSAVRLFRDGRAQRLRVREAPHALVVTRLAAHEVRRLKNHVAARVALPRRAEQGLPRRVEARDGFEVVPVVFEVRAEVRMHDVGHVRAAARRRRCDAVACRARVAHVSAQRVRHGEFEQARLLRGENVLDPSPHARGTLVGARAHQPLDGDDAAAVDDDAHGCERHERERDEDE